MTETTGTIGELEPSAPPTATVKPKLRLKFSDLDGSPIPDLNVRVVIWDQAKDYSTDGEGAIDDIEGPAGAALRIEIKRLDGTYKCLDRTTMPGSTKTWWEYLSPSNVTTVTTELHQGSKGTIEEEIPTPATGDEGNRPNPSVIEPAKVETQVVHPDGPVEVHPLPPQHAAAPDKTSERSASSAPATKSNPPAPTPTAKAPAPPHRLPEIRGATTPPFAQAPRTVGRTEKGTPMTVLQGKVRDWWNGWTLPSLNIWGPHTGANKLPATASNKSPGLTSSGKPVLMKGAGGSVVPYSPSMLPVVEALILFATEQTEYRYSNGTQSILAEMEAKKFKHQSGEKRSGESIGQCYKYVRVALTYSRTIEGMLAGGMSTAIQESASRAGTALLAKGFVDVTHEVPDARWAAAGDIIVYEWSDKTWAKNKKNNPSKPNHGHIDIRSIESYISDFVPKSGTPKWVDNTTVSPAEQKDGKKPESYANYVNIRIYRKYYDPLPTCRIRAFLACIREFEVTSEADDAKRYWVLNRPLPGQTERQGSCWRFTGQASHPWAAVPIGQHPNGTKDRPGSTAAGAYQILFSTWKKAIDDGFFPDLEGKDAFSPEAQDRMAVRLIEAWPGNPLRSIRSGNIKEAVEALTGAWSSLPGGKENERRLARNGSKLDMKYFMGLFEERLCMERKKYGC